MRMAAVLRSAKSRLWRDQPSCTLDVVCYEAIQVSGRSVNCCGRLCKMLVPLTSAVFCSIALVHSAADLFR